MIIGYLDFKKMQKWKQILFWACFAFVTFFIMIVLTDNEKSRQERQDLIEKYEQKETDFHQSRMTSEGKGV